MEVTYTLTNSTNEVVDYANTVIFNLDQSVVAAAAVPTRGSTTISARQVAWGGFALNPNESADITMTLDITPVSASAGRAISVITNITITGRTASGGLVNVPGGGLTSSSISCLANGGLVLAPVPGGSPVVNSPTASQPPRTAPSLPRTGSGAMERSGLFGSDPWTLSVMGLAAGCAFLGALLLARRARPRRDDL